MAKWTDAERELVEALDLRAMLGDDEAENAAAIVRILKDELDARMLDPKPAQPKDSKVYPDLRKIRYRASREKVHREQAVLGDMPEPVEKPKREAKS